MPELDLDVEQEMQKLLSLLLAQRADLGEMLEQCSNNPLLFDEVASLKSACAKLDRAATELNWALETGLERDPDDHDPRRNRRILIAQYKLLGVWANTLTEVIEELNGEGEGQEEPAN